MDVIIQRQQAEGAAGVCSVSVWSGRHTTTAERVFSSFYSIVSGAGRHWLTGGHPAWRKMGESALYRVSLNCKHLNLNQFIFFLTIAHYIQNIEVICIAILKNCQDRFKACRQPQVCSTLVCTRSISMSTVSTNRQSQDRPNKSVLFSKSYLQSKMLPLYNLHWLFQWRPWSLYAVLTVLQQRTAPDNLYTLSHPKPGGKAVEVRSRLEQIIASWNAGGAERGHSRIQMREEVGGRVCVYLAKRVHQTLAEKLLLPMFLFSTRVWRVLSRLPTCASPKWRKSGTRPGKQRCPLVSPSHNFIDYKKIMRNGAESEVGPEPLWDNGNVLLTAASYP